MVSKLRIMWKQTVVVDAKVKSNRGNINTLSEGKWLMATNWYLVTLRR